MRDGRAVEIDIGDRRPECRPEIVRGVPGSGGSRCSSVVGGRRAWGARSGGGEGKAAGRQAPARPFLPVRKVCT